MTPDFEMVVHDLGNNDITIIPVSDVHLGAAEHNTRAWEEFVNMVIETPNVYLTLGGDLINNNIRTAVGDIWKEQFPPSTQRKIMAKMLEPLRDRILAGVTGNHERRSTKDADSDANYAIMSKLDLEDRWRENIAFIKIQLGKQTTDNGGRSAGADRQCYCLVLTHGSGGGIYTGTAVLRGERFGYSIDGMDILILGHTHKPFVTQPGKIVIDPRNNSVSVKPFRVVSCSSWLEWGGYAAQKMLLPSTHMKQAIVLSAKHKGIEVRVK